MTPMTSAADNARHPAAAAGPAGAVVVDTATAPALVRRRRPKDIGTAAETAVVRFLQANGFPHAERRALKGAYDQGDVTGTPGICWEVKGGKAAKTASDVLVSTWLSETERERRNAHVDIGILVLQRTGVGAGNAGRWWTVSTAGVVGALATRTERGYWDHSKAPVRMHLCDMAALLRFAGYGDPVSELT